MKIICIGRNYINHALELNNPIPKQPLVFMKPTTALLSDNRPFYYPNFTNDFHYEGEIVLKIAKNGKCIQEQFANSYYNEITMGIDFTARDLQNECKSKGHPWEIAKAFDYSAVIGKFITFAENLNDIAFSLQKNGQIVQAGNTKDLIFNFDYLISYVSHFFTLQRGDLIFTGTPAGVGAVKVGDILNGFIGEQHLLHCEVR